MKNEITQRVFTILAVGAVLAYTIYNYVSGGSDFLYFVVAAAILTFPLVANVVRLISDLRNS